MGPIGCVILGYQGIYTGGDVICASEDTCCCEAGLLYTMFISSVHIFLKHRNMGTLLTLFLSKLSKP